MINNYFEILENERKYREYLVKHIEGVEAAYNRLIVPLKDKYDNAVSEAVDLCGQYIVLHDLTKYSKNEFNAYRKHFYPTDEEKEQNKISENDFEKAVVNHYLKNAHHPYYWVKDNVPEDIPLNFIFEMFCDWSSVSSYYDTSVMEWYSTADKEKAAFTEKTRETVDYWLNEIYVKPNIKY